MRIGLLLGSLASLLAATPAVVPVAAQVTLVPRTAEPADFVRFALLVANPRDTAIVDVRLEVPEALTILGVDAPGGWTVQLTAATDSTPQVVEWSGGELPQRQFREFTFFTRLAGDVSRNTLVFPVRLRRADGSVREWRPGGEGAAPTVEIRGNVGATPGAAFALSAAALGLAVLALALAIRRPR